MKYFRRNLWTYLLSTVILCACQKVELSDSDQINSTTKANEISDNITTSPAGVFSNLFDRFGDGWTGGDGVYSYELPDGRILWTYGDSFLGTVNPDYTRPGGPLINNCFVIQNGSSLTTLAGGTDENPEAYVQPWDNDNHWYWPGHGQVVGNKLYMCMLRLRSSGEGGVWGFEHIGTDMAVFSLPELEIIDQYEIARTTQYLMGVSTFREGNTIYVYGTRSTIGKRCLAARINVNTPGNIEYWDGESWGPDFIGNAYLQTSNSQDLIVSNQFTVFRHRGKYRLLTQEDFLGSRIYLYSSDNLTGPWTNRQLVYDTPETGGNIFTYNAFLHEHIVHPQKGALVTYSVNSQNFWDLFSDARIYRPRYFWLNESES